MALSFSACQNEEPLDAPVAKDALALIKLHRERIVALRVLYDNECKQSGEARAEAIREFAERIKEQSYESIDWSHGVHPLVCEFAIVEEIAEEMTEEQK